MKRLVLYFSLLLLLGACANSNDKTKIETPVTKQDSTEIKLPIELPKMGMVFNEKTYEKVPKKETLKLSSYEKLPSSFSLKAYCPKVEYQKYSTCVGWSTAYYARTILHAQKQGLKNIDKITENAFSPGFVYRATTQQLGSVDKNCEKGTDIGEALNILQNRGSVLLKDFPDECFDGNIAPAFQKAGSYKIKTFMRLSDKTENNDLQLKKIKKSLSDGFPIVIGIETMPSFMVCTTAVWKSKENEKSLGGHALCMIGYDDNKEGGAFQIVNSWGEDWGEKGFVWMRYEDYFKYARCAFEVAGNNSEPNPEPKVVPKVKPKVIPLEEPKPIDIEMVFVQGGNFLMGCTSEQGNRCRLDIEMPVHRVTLSSYNIGKYEVTQAQWRAVMGSDPSFLGCENCPVNNINWNDIQEFINKLNRQTGKRYRLPTEAEWEYAARGGNKSRGFKYAGSNNLDDVGHNLKTHETHSVGQKLGNELGIYDMSGNVSECCSDRYDEHYYSSSPSSNPQGPYSGIFRVYRGGSHQTHESNCRSSSRDYAHHAVNVNYFGGFRLAHP